MRTDYCGLIDTKYLNRTITLYGWVHRRRDHGGVIFVDLRDREGLVQVVCDPDNADAFGIAERFVTSLYSKLKAACVIARRYGKHQSGQWRDRGAGSIHRNSQYVADPAVSDG